MERLEASIVAILDAQGKVAGTGFVAGDRLVVTCAHVVTRAQSAPGQKVQVRFHVNADIGGAEVVAALWSEPALNDVAILRLEADRPPAAPTLRLGAPPPGGERQFETFGYRRLGDVTGLYAEGELRGEVRTDNNLPRLQLQTVTLEVEHGMSGAPVVEATTQLVVGMIHYGSTSNHTLLAIPAETICALCPALGVPANWPQGHTYATQPNFTGRAAEREALSAWLEAGPTVRVVRALGGFGKSALAWHWLLNDVDAPRWPRALWWSFYDERAFETFLDCALEALGAPAGDLKPRQQVDKLLEALGQPGTLIILDGFERALRAFGDMNAAYQGDSPAPTPTLPLGKATGEAPTQPPPPGSSPAREGAEGAGVDCDCISPLAEQFLRGAASRPNLRGRVLLTTRLRPRVLEGHDQQLLQYCCEAELTALHPDDAVALFQALGVKGTHGEIQAACEPYGYHPLSLRLLAGYILNDLREPGDIRVAQRLDLTGDLVQRQNHVLAQTFGNLVSPHRKLLSRLACFRNPMTYGAICAIEQPPPPLPAAPPPPPPDRSFWDRLLGRNKPAPPVAAVEPPQPPTVNCDKLDAALKDLISHGLLHHDSRLNSYDLHPIVRRYAYDRLDDKPAAHTRLRVYFIAIEVVEKFQALEALNPLIELYHHTVHAGLYDEAFELFRDRLAVPLYYQFGAYQLRIELLLALFPDGESQSPRLKEESAQAWALNSLANSCSLSGQPRRAVSLFERQIALREKLGNKKGPAIGLVNVADDQLKIGVLQVAEANLRRSVALCREIEEKFNEAVGHQELGHVLAYRGVWAEAEQELATALEMFEKQSNVQSQGVVWAHRALEALLRARDGQASPHLASGQAEAALQAARRALELADEYARTIYPVERDYVRAHWLLGAAHAANDHPDEAERHLTEALTRCRAINLVEMEADILIEMARLALSTAAPTPNPREAPSLLGSPAQRGRGADLDEAERLLKEALAITERCGYVLQGADAHLGLAQVALARGDRAEARRHAEMARKLAECNGEPYVYRVAYEAAGRLLEQLAA